MADDVNPMGYEIVWLGFNDKPNYNRIWGYLKMSDDRYYAFWGVKGKRQQFKLQQEWTLSMLVNQQTHKGYKQIDPSHYEQIAPGFHEDLELWLTTNILADSFR